MKVKKKIFVTLDKKRVHVFRFQEELAIEIAKKIMNGNRNIGIETGLGRRIILQRVVDLLNPKNLHKLYNESHQER